MKGKKLSPRRAILFISALFLFCSNIVLAATIKVPEDQPTIQAGIDAASNGDIVLVADGTYTGEGNKNLDFKGKAITVQSQNGAQKCIIDCENEGRGFNFHTEEGTDSVLSGFTIKNGKVDGYGGAIYCISSSPTLIHCRISHNSCSGQMGWPSQIPGGDGGGIYCSSSSPTITSCTISYNSANGASSYSAPCGLGGGISCNNTSSPIISKCMIIGNSACRGGGIGLNSSSAIINNCFIYNNNPENGIASNTIFPNTLPPAILGGGIYCNSSSPEIMNCTIRANFAHRIYGEQIGGGLYSDSASSPEVTNTIIWDNSPNEFTGDATITYSDIKGGYPGLGNIDADPHFVANGVYQLSSNSPCIDSGTSNGAPSVDIDDSPRPKGLGVDMGAYEFSLPALAPTVRTASATNITDSAATLNGTVNPNGGSSWYYFEYGTSTSYGSKTLPESAAAGTSALLVSAGINGLTNNTYHFRIVGENNAGTSYGLDQTFTTSPSAPSVTTDEATSVGATSATLNGTINSNGAATSYFFEYGPAETYGNVTETEEAGASANPVSVSSEIIELELNKTYHFRLVATNEKGTANGSDQTFTTKALAPEVTSDSASSVTSSSATLNGSINPNGASTAYYFEYGMTSAYGSKTIDTSAGSGASSVKVNANISGLNKSTTYHFRLVAKNSVGTTSGGDQTFTTTLSPLGPTVTTGSATLITSDSVILKGKVNPNGSNTDAYFEYGTTTSYGFSTPLEDVGAGTDTVIIDATISDLMPNTTYHYRLTATNSEGTSSGTDMTFFTSVIYVSSDGICNSLNPCYSNIQAGIDSVSSPTVSRIVQGIFEEDIVLDAPNRITLQGGWDSTFSSQTSNTVINSLTITDTSGTIEIDKMVLQ